MGVFLSSKLWFHYKGAIFWKLRAGMGEAVFAPIYQALIARGVRFRFFAEVQELVPSADGSTSGRSWSAGGPRWPRGWTGTSRW